RGRKNEEADELAVLAGDAGVGDERRAGGDGADAELADGDPGPRRELEVLGEAPVEDDALGGLARVLQAAGVAGGQEALVVEDGGLEDAAAPPGSRRDVGAFDAHLELVLARREAERAGGRRQARDAGAAG